MIENLKHETKTNKEYINKKNDYIDIQNIKNEIKAIKLIMNKKEDDLKNIINEKEKNYNEKIKELYLIINEQKEELINLKNEFNIFKNEMKLLLKNYISNMDSLIIDNNNHNSILKNWINPNLEIRANLLYRKSRDGPEISTFHRLCDNKGSTLTLFHLKNEEKIGFFINESFDSYSGWKKDDNCFIFNLNQNKKYKKNFTSPKIFIKSSFLCQKNCGPSVANLGCNVEENLNFIYHSVEFIDNNFINGKKILPSENDEEGYEVIETEIFQIIIT